jgi:[ribosomal protein S5]-alanine N-acetyltransferase
MDRITLETERLVLRNLTLDDAEAIVRLAGHPEVAAGTLTIPHPYEREDAVDFIERCHELWEKGTEYTFAITRKPEPELIGCIGFGPRYEHRRGEMGYWVGVPFWGSGYATEAARFCLW